MKYKAGPTCDDDSPRIGVALLFSTVFEGLTWELITVVGVGLVVVGNVIAMTRRRQVSKEELPSPAQAS